MDDLTNLVDDDFEEAELYKGAKEGVDRVTLFDDQDDVDVYKKMVGAVAHKLTIDQCFLN